MRKFGKMKSLEAFTKLKKKKKKRKTLPEECSLGGNVWQEARVAIKWTDPGITVDNEKSLDWKSNRKSLQF